MSCLIKITDPSNALIWKKLGSSDDYDEMNSLTKTSPKMFDLFSSLLTPVRTNNLSNFAKDLFLPTTTHYAIKIQNIALRVLAIIASVILDVITLPIRLATCYSRISYNNS